MADSLPSLPSWASATAPVTAAPAGSARVREQQRERGKGQRQPERSLRLLPGQAEVSLAFVLSRYDRNEKWDHCALTKAKLLSPSSPCPLPLPRFPLCQSGTRCVLLLDAPLRKKRRLLFQCVKLELELELEVPARSEYLRVTRRISNCIQARTRTQTCPAASSASSLSPSCSPSSSTV